MVEERWCVDKKSEEWALLSKGASSTVLTHNVTDGIKKFLNSYI